MIWEYGLLILASMFSFVLTNWLARIFIKPKKTIGLGGESDFEISYKKYVLMFKRMFFKLPLLIIIIWFIKLYLGVPGWFWIYLVTIIVFSVVLRRAGVNIND